MSEGERRQAGLDYLVYRLWSKTATSRRLRHLTTPTGQCCSAVTTEKLTPMRSAPTRSHHCRMRSSKIVGKRSPPNQIDNNTCFPVAVRCRLEDKGERLRRRRAGLLQPPTQSMPSQAVTSLLAESSPFVSRCLRRRRYPRSQKAQPLRIYSCRTRRINKEIKLP